MKNKLQILVTLLFLGMVVWWASFQHVVAKQGPSVEWFGGTYGVLALIGAIIGLVAAYKWGGVKTVLGRAITFFAFGLLAQEFGQLIYTYYAYALKIQIPYPSWGDVAYFGSVLIYITAVIFLSKFAGVKFSLKDPRYKVIALAVPVVLLSASYYILLHHHHYDTSKPLTVFLDFGYPMGQAIYISIALIAYLLSRKMLGGVMKRGILMIILALCLQYVSDFTFVYQSNRGTYLSGKYDDLFYLIAYYAMTMALIQMLSTYSRVKKGAAMPATQTASPKEGA